MGHSLLYLARKTRDSARGLRSMLGAGRSLRVSLSSVDVSVRLVKHKRRSFFAWEELRLSFVCLVPVQANIRTRLESTTLPLLRLLDQASNGREPPIGHRPGTREGSRGRRDASSAMRVASPASRQLQSCLQASLASLKVRHAGTCSSAHLRRSERTPLWMPPFDIVAEATGSIRSFYFIALVRIRSCISGTAPCGTMRDRSNA